MNFTVVYISQDKTPKDVLDAVYGFYRTDKNQVNQWVIEGGNAGLFKDWILLATCHRFELYTTNDKPGQLKDFFSKLLTKMTKKSIKTVVQYQDEKALGHLVNVAAGVDSKILGEVDIFSQVKKAYESSRGYYSKSGLLSYIFSHAIKIALKLRNRFNIEQGFKSYLDVALSLLPEGLFRNKRVLLFGAGMLASAFAKKFGCGKTKLTIASRSIEHAAELAEKYNARSIDAKLMPRVVNDMDLIITCMAGGVLDYFKKISKKDLWVIDLGVPTNVPPSVDKQVYKLYRLNDLDRFIDEDNLKKEPIKCEMLNEIQKEIDLTFKDLLNDYTRNNVAIGEKEKDSAKEITKDLILSHVLDNAIKHGGIPVEGAVLSSLFNEGLTKDKIKDTIPKIKKLVGDVKKLSKEKQIEEFSRLKGLMKEIVHDKSGLPELPNVAGEVITRIAPEPSKYCHIGHALIFMIQYLYAKKYNGQCILRMEDTNPEKSTQEFYDAIKQDLVWLDIKWDKEILVSNEMSLFYDYAEKMIKQNDAYACSCIHEQITKLREEMEECSCRKKSVETNLKEWNGMLQSKYAEGELVIRLKGDMMSNNGAMRDPVIFRISYSPHFIHNKKYCVWPMYDFENPIEDSMCKITHVIRTKEFEMRTELHKYILYLLDMKSPIIKEIARYNIEGATTKGREIRKLIEDRKIGGWDDPRLVTIKALRRRGFLPETFKELATRVGLSKGAGKIDFSVIDSINRKILDPKVNRYFFIENPKKIRIKGSPIKKTEAPLHPTESRGKRPFNLSDEFYISDKIAKGKTYRLMHLFNFKDGKFVSEEYDPELKAKLIHWLPAEGNIQVEILMPDGTVLKGLGEHNLKNVKAGEIIQFERFGFCRLDKKGEKYEFWYTHN